MSQNNVLALYVSRRGIAFAYFLDGHTLHDWGLKEIRGVDRQGSVLAVARSLLKQFHPRVLVCEQVGRDGSRRAPRICKLTRAVVSHAKRRGIPVQTYSRAAMRESFAATGTTKHEMSCRIAELYPALSHRIPRKRRAWDPESAVQALFDASALAVTFFARQGVL